MARTRLTAAIASLVLLALSANAGLAQSKKKKATPAPDSPQTLPSPMYTDHPPQYFPPSPAYPLPRELKSQTEAAQAAQQAATKVTKVYSLADLGTESDVRMQRWLVETIPTIVEPQSWKKTVPDPLAAWQTTKQTINSDGGFIVSNETSRMIVVVQTPAVQTQVENFLKEVRQATPKDAGVTQAQHLTPALQRVPDAVAKASAPGASYPIPTAAQQPKHLFHLLFGFKGELGDVNPGDLLGSFNKSLMPAFGETSTPRVTITAGRPAEFAPVVSASLSDEKPKSDDLVLPKIFPPADADDTKSPMFVPAEIVPAKGEQKAEPKAESQKASYGFSFLVRYEGDGIVDANVVKLVKAVALAEKKNEGSVREVVPMMVPVPANVPSMAPSPTSVPSCSPATMPISPSSQPVAIPQGATCPLCPIAVPDAPATSGVVPATMRSQSPLTPRMSTEPRQPQY